jgi:hypothetical protein
MSKALFLDSPVEPLDVSIVVGSPQSTMSYGNPSPPHPLLKVAAKLRSIVSLYHREAETEVALSPLNGFGRSAGQDTLMYLSVSHAGVKIDHGVDVAPTLSQWTNVVNGVGLYELTRPRNDWTPGVLRSNTILPGAVKAVMAPQDAADAAKADGNLLLCHKMVPDDFCATLELLSQCQDPSDERQRQGPWAGLGLGAERRNTPATGQ